MSFRPIPLSLSLISCASSAFAAVDVYPVPGDLRETGGPVVISSSARIVGAETADPDAVALLKTRVAKGASSGDIREILIGKKGDAAVAGRDAELPAVSGAYRIRTEPGRLVLVGADARGTFYAMQTLRQLLDADANPADMPACSVDDAPVVPFRGVVEGFYGTPGDCWNHGGRLSLLTFMGRWKMDTYIYGPKDDPYHRSQWRKPYPETDAVRIRELVTAARANKVDFVWAVHPGGDIRWTEADYLAAKSKFEDMYRLGVRTFAVFFDDIGGEGTRAEKQAAMLNRLDREFVKPKGDVSPLILCPTQYNKSWADPKKGGYLDVLGETLEPSIRVMWTGNTVVADVDGASMAYINGRLLRKAWIWWNAPCNDFCRTNLNMGPVYADTDGLSADIRARAKALGQRIFGNTAAAASQMSGFTSNPMGRSEASKTALFGVAGYCWNPVKYDAVAAWERSMGEVVPGAPAAFRTFCEHNSDNGPNGHGYRRPESVALAPVADRALASLRDGHPDAAAFAALRAEFVKVAAAPAAIRAGAGNPELLRETGAWLDAFAQLGEAGIGASDAAVATELVDIARARSKATSALAAMRGISNAANRDPHQPGVAVGSLVLTPFVKEAVRLSSARLMSAASGLPVPVVRPESNSRSTETLARMCDGDPKSYFYSEQNQKVGDWFALDLGGEAAVSRVTLVMGRKDGDHDIVYRGVLEYSNDGATWKPFSGETEGERVSWSGAAVKAKKVRYRVTRAGNPDGSRNNVWCAVREFAVNPPVSPARMAGDVAPIRALPVSWDGVAQAATPQFEVVPFPAGASVSLELPEAVKLSRIEADLSSAPGVFVAEISRDGKKWDAVPASVSGNRMTATTGATARFVRVRNRGDKPADIRLQTFRVVPEAGQGSPVASWSDGDFDTGSAVGADVSLRVPEGAKAVTVFFAPGSGAGAVLKRSDGATLAELSEDVRTVPLDASVAGRDLRLESSKRGAVLNEVVFRTR